MRFKLANNMRVQLSSLYLTTDYSPSYWKEKPFDSSRILVDTNGEKGPNTVGYDIFFFGFLSRDLSSSSLLMRRRDSFYF